MHRIAFPACFLSLLFCLSLIPAGSYSQENAITIGNKLTANQREWILIDTKPTLGQQKCINGELYRFRQNNKVFHKFCNAGTWNNKTVTWFVKKVGNDWQITINRDQYILVLGKEGKKDRLVLRTIGNGKTAVTTDRIYVSE